MVFAIREINQASSLNLTRSWRSKSQISYREEGLRFCSQIHKPDPHTINEAERDVTRDDDDLNRAVEYAAAADYRTDPVFMEPIINLLRSTVGRIVYVHNNLPHDCCFHLQTLILKTKVRLRSQILFFFFFPIISFGDGWMNRAKSTFLSTAQSLVTSSHHVFIILYFPFMPLQYHLKLRFYPLIFYFIFFLGNKFNLTFWNPQFGSKVNGQAGSHIWLRGTFTDNS